jgi:hypothetical protein
MNDEIEITESAAGGANEFNVPSPVAEGWLCFSTLATAAPFLWTNVPVVNPTGVFSDPYRCPYPLHQSKEAAIEAAKRYMSGGGKIKLVFVSLK